MRKDALLQDPIKERLHWTVDRDLGGVSRRAEVNPQRVGLRRSSGATVCCLSPLRLRAATHLAPRDLSCEPRAVRYVVSCGLCAAPDAALCQSPGRSVKRSPGQAAGPQHLMKSALWQAL